MPKHILADTSCLILLEKIERLEWLKVLFGELIVVEEVAEEFGSSLPDWIEIRKVTQQQRLATFLAENLGKGEAASIALALELNNPLLILDDQKARKKARNLKLNITGTSGILLLAKKKGLCATIKPELEALIGAGMWLSQDLIQAILASAGEA